MLNPIPNTASLRFPTPHHSDSLTSTHQCRRNEDLNGLVGGSVSMTIGDEMARSRNARMGGIVSKVQTQRRGDLTFDVVVEIKSGAPNEWRVITDATRAVDSILSGKQYKAEVSSSVRLDHPSPGNSNM